MTTKEKKRNRNRTYYRFGYFKPKAQLDTRTGSPGKPVFIKYKKLDGESIQEAHIEPIGHIYLLRDTYRRFLSILRRRAARSKNIRRQQLRHTLSSRS